MKVLDYEKCGVWDSADNFDKIPSSCKRKLGKDDLLAVYSSGDIFAVRKSSGRYCFFGYRFSNSGQLNMEKECVAKALGFRKEARKFRKIWIKKYLSEIENMTWDTMSDAYKIGMKWLVRNNYITGPKTIEEWDDWKKAFVWSNGIFLKEKGRNFLKRRKER